MKEHYLVTASGDFQINIDDTSNLHEAITTALPLKGEAKNIGGEIFYIVDLDIPFDGTEREVFEVGDLVYWRSQKEQKFAIAMFYGNTKFGSGDAPTAASPCMKFGSFKGDCSGLEKIDSGSKIYIEYRNQKA